MLRELLYLIVAVAAGLHAAISTADLVLFRLTHQHLTGALSLFFSPWILPVTALLAIHARHMHAWLRGARVNNCQPAAVYPHRDPIFGLDWMVDMSKLVKSSRVMEAWDSLFHTVGSTFWVNSMGSWLLYTNEPENLKAMLSTDFESWPIGGVRQKSSQMAVGQHAIFSVNGPEWHRARAIIRPSFVRNQIADLECMDRHVEKLLAKMPKDGRAFDVQPLLYDFTMDVATDFMFGYSTNTLESPSSEALAFTQSFDYALTHATSRSRMGWAALLFPDKKLQEARKTCQRFIDRFVSQALAGDNAKERPYVFMNEMLETGASHEVIRDQLMGMILGGRDTSASTMSSLLWILARRPDVVKKLRADIATLQDRKPTWEELKELKYLNYVLKEILRVWAPVPSNSRLAHRDTVLPKGGGPDGQSPLFVAKGTSCRWTWYSLHRRKDVFGDDADEFRPERWETLRTSWGYTPFSGGPRICIGQQFALTQMLYVMTRLFQAFVAIEAADNLPMTQKVSTTVSLVNGCWISLGPA